MPRIACLLLLCCGLGQAWAAGGGRVYADDNGNGRMDAGERGIHGVAVSNGRDVVRTGADGRYRLTIGAGDTVFLVKPAGWRVPARADGLPAFWRQQPLARPLPLRHGGLEHGRLLRGIDLGLQRAPPAAGPLDVLVFGDPQPASATDVGYYAADIVAPLVGRHGAALGLSLGDIVNDDLSLYPAMNAATSRLGVPWLHVAGNHDIDFDAVDDATSTSSFRRTFGPDTFAWEEQQAVFVGLDNVVYQPGRKPAYIGGLREDQLAFLAAYLPTVPKDRLLVLAMHIPLFEAEPGRDTFRDADRARLFALLQPFARVLVLSAHEHTQRHWLHGTDTGWAGATPLHEYNVGATCGAYWSGVKDAQGIPDSTMADGTPNGHATLRVEAGGRYSLAWHVAREPDHPGIGLHAPRVLRQGAYPAWGVFANVYMGGEGTQVDFRVDDGQWRPMLRVERPDPRLLAENVADDQAPSLRGHDRSPEAEPSAHLWRGALPTDLAPGEHAVEVRARDTWQGELRARTGYRLDVAAP